METLGLIGYPVEHSYSQKIHSAVVAKLGLDYHYKLFNISPAKLEVAVEGMRLFDFCGLNVTVPHKTAVIEYLDEIAQSALLCGAVNTIVNKGGKLIGHNTDYEGFKEALRYHQFDVKEKNILVLGAGGAARAIVAALTDLKAKMVYIANRTISSAEELAQAFPHTQAIGITPDKIKPIMEDIYGVINTTTLGMYPNINVEPLLSADLLKKVSYVYDIIYNPTQTSLLLEAKRAGCKTANGLEMLVQQGAHSFYLWTGVKPPLETMREVLV